MYKFWTTIILLFSITICSGQQPEPCITPDMTPLCEDACVICDIDGFSGINNSTVTGVAPDDFCTTEVHNVTWIAFIAGSEDLTLEVTVTNCQINWGLEIGIYESLDCENMQQVSFCNTDIQPNTTASFSNTIPLIVGQYYYFVMDGSNGDICNYSVAVTEGTTAVGELTPITEINGPEIACPGQIQTFEVPTLEGANFMEWTINDNLVLEGTPILEHEWTSTGAMEICYSAYNVCDEIPPVCKTVIVENLPIVNYVEEICGDDCLYVSEMDTLICEEGIYNFNFITDEGCTQIINVDLSISPPVYTPLSLTFCYGDSVIIGGQSISESGQYEISIPFSFACDSIVQLNVTTILCDIEGGFDDDNLNCYGDSNGELVFNLVDGAFPFSYSWEEETGSGLVGNGISSNSSGLISINSLTQGIYSITVTDDNESVGIFVGQVFEPTPITVSTVYSDYNGTMVSCFGANDGSIALFPEGGTPGYSFNWGNNIDTNKIDSLTSGNYTTTIVDNNGCLHIINSTIIEPNPILVNVFEIDPGCNPNDSGSITLGNISGGAAPYLYSLDGNGLTTDSVFTNLLPGTYLTSVTDANGCYTTITTTFTDPNTLILDAGEEQLVLLGNSIELEPITNESGLTFEWTPNEGLSCVTCENPITTPINTTLYTVIATMPNGCTQTDDVLIRVDKIRNFYVPNAFSPNGDGYNDWLQIYAGQEVVRVIEFNIFSRWGELVYSKKDFVPNDFLIGWDGVFNDKIMDSNVFAWSAKVEYLDGVFIQHSGDVTLVK